jgi:thiol-disulfide isomerase/thioredoxin
LSGAGPRWLCGLLVLACAAISTDGGAPPGLTPVTTRELKAALRSTAGRPLVVHLWASWCAPCVAELPALAAYLREVAGRRLDIVTLALDRPSAVAEAAKVLAGAGGVPGRALVAAPEAAFPAIRAVEPGWAGAVPTTLLIDGGGKVVLSQQGVTRLEELSEEIDRLAPPGDKHSERKEEP